MTKSRGISNRFEEREIKLEISIVQTYTDNINPDNTGKNFYEKDKSHNNAFRNISSYGNFYPFLCDEKFRNQKITKARNL